MAEKQSRTPKVKVEEPVVETTAEGTAVVETTTTTVGTATTVTTERHPTEVPTGTQARPTVTAISAPPPRLPASFQLFERTILTTPEVQWGEKVDAEIHRLRSTRDAITPADLADWRQQLTDYCTGVREWRDADR